MGLTAEEVRSILANTVRKSAQGDGHAQGGQADKGRVRREQENRERLRTERGPISSTPRMGLTDEEIRAIIANAVRKPTQSDEKTKDVRTDTGRDRDDDVARGASMSR